MISNIFRNFPSIQMIFGKRFLSGHFFKFFRDFLFPNLIFFLTFDIYDAKQNTLSLTLIGVVTTRPHSEESRPEIQKSSGGRWGTRHGGGLIFPMLLRSRSDVTTALSET